MMPQPQVPKYKSYIGTAVYYGAVPLMLIIGITSFIKSADQMNEMMENSKLN